MGEAVSVLGGVPNFADVSEETANLGPPSLETAAPIVCQPGLSSRGAIMLRRIRLWRAVSD